MDGVFLDGVKKAIAQKEGDAGSTWDRQALFFYDQKTKHYFLWFKNYSTKNTSIDCESINPFTENGYKSCLKSAKIECRLKAAFYKLNPKSKAFLETKFNGNKPKRMIPPFDLYKKTCLK
jgi:hypothetical protein